eukprot:scaffold266768_cov31-Tisochrysis_lutea.AAC.2
MRLRPRGSSPNPEGAIAATEPEASTKRTCGRFLEDQADPALPTRSGARGIKGGDRPAREAGLVVIEASVARDFDPLTGWLGGEASV